MNDSKILAINPTNQPQHVICDTNGKLSVNVSGNTNKNGSGDDYNLVCDVNGTLQTTDFYTNQKLTALLDRTKPVVNAQVKLGSATSVLVIGGEQTPIADEEDRAGWLFKKAASDAAKFNYYLYSQGSHAFTLGQIDTIFMIGSVDVWDNISSVPYFIIYTKPTGVGDAEVWYHSKILYTLDATKKINIGESVNMYCITNPNLNNGLRHIELSTRTVTGDGLDSEEILYITVHSDSSALINTKILLSNVGYSLNSEVSRNISLVT